MINDIIYRASEVFQVALFVLTMYYLLISLFGLYRKKEEIVFTDPEKRFALIVAAHNEEMVVVQVVDSLNNLDYPREMFDVMVIADNCNDNTAEVARQHGAMVFERNDPKNVGKGFALEFMFGKIFEMETKYDAIMIFDADNLASKNVLKEMDRKLKQGYKVIQGYLDSKNPHDTWITECYSLSFWTANRICQLSRSNLGLSNQLGGTGFCVDIEVLKELGWGATCLTEDLQFTCKLVLNGYKVGWAHDAVIYDEKPLKMQQSWRQRKRWMQGFADVSSMYFWKLVKRAFLKRDFKAIDCALYTIQPLAVIGIAIAIVLNLLKVVSGGALNIFELGVLIPGVIFKVYAMAQFLITPYMMTLDNKLPKRALWFFGLYSISMLVSRTGYDVRFKYLPFTMIEAGALIGTIALVYLIEGRKILRTFIRYLLFGIYNLTWIPITIQGIINKNKKEWCHTIHTRQISINDIEKKSVA